ncbi:hypothetical protein [Streptomyces aquilus]|uniref:hypothetical protein n=1 Tax=Streptomyces aquilus TaxID=2548456 RepID=UPI0036AF0D71
MASAPSSPPAPQDDRPPADVPVQGLSVAAGTSPAPADLADRHEGTAGADEDAEYEPL